MRTPYEEWKAELEGEKPKGSGWIVFAAIMITIGGLAALAVAGV